MAHILLLILKTAGLILIATLAILAILVGAALYMPVCYKLSICCDGSLKSLRVKGRAKWLFRLFGATFAYEGGKWRYNFRAVWKKRGKKGKRKEERDGRNKKKKKTMENHKKTENNLEDNKKYKNNSEEMEKESDVSKKTGNGFPIFRKIADKIKKMKYTFENFCGRIKVLLEKKEMLAGFMKEEIHRRAFFKAGNELARLLKRLAPKKFCVEAVFGFEEPNLTGKALAGISMIYPFFGEDIRITPDFERQILKGKIFVKGKLRISFCAAFALRLLLNKEIRKTYADCKGGLGDGRR